MFEAGQRIGAFEIVARLQSGGMATLYLGRRAGAAGFSRHVAIKVVHPHLASDEKFVAMFIAEAKLCSRIHHPNVVHVEEFGEAEGTHFLVMEYVHGCSLAQLLKVLAKKKRRLAPELAAYIALQVCDALHAAHEASDERGRPLGVVHRDVTPQNVLLSYKGHVKLIDFGIAKAGGAVAHTAAGSLKGKFRYMSPEQARGERIDRRSDVYGLGVVLWEALTARRLFDSETELAALELAKNPKIKPPSSIAPEIPPALEAAVMAALEPDASKRIGGAKELRRRIAAAIPQAAAIDDEQLAELLTAVMTDEIAKQQKQLPESVSQLVEPPSPPAPSGEAEPDVLRTLIVPDPGAGSAADANEASAPSAVSRSVSVVAFPSPARRLAPLVIGAVVLAGVAIGAVVALELGGDEETVTPSPLVAPAGPPPAAPEPPSSAAAPVEPPHAQPVPSNEPQTALAPDAGPAGTGERVTPVRGRGGRRGGRTGRTAPGGGPLLLDDPF